MIMIYMILISPILKNDDDDDEIKFHQIIHQIVMKPTSKKEFLKNIILKSSKQDVFLPISIYRRHLSYHFTIIDG